MKPQRLEIFIGTLLCVFFPVSSTFASTVLSSYKYAWSNNSGYINFENLVVSDSALSGYAWSGNAAWIKFNPTEGGVSNDGAGNLSGFAWGSNLGWIDFSGVSIDGSTGKFSGTATGSLVGTITFDCPDYCDVRTDWRQETVSVEPRERGGGGGRIPVAPIPVPILEEISIPSQYIETHNEPLILLPPQSGTVIQDTNFGQVIVNIPAASVLSETTFFITKKTLSMEVIPSVLLDATLVYPSYFVVEAVDKDGHPIHFFPAPLTITLPVPRELEGTDHLAVYWLNEVNEQWVLIPDAVFSDGSVTFQVNHLTKFAIFKRVAGAKQTVSLPPHLLLGQEQKIVSSSYRDSLLLPQDYSLAPTNTETISFREQSQRVLKKNFSVFFISLGATLVFVLSISFWIRHYKKKI